MNTRYVSQAFVFVITTLLVISFGALANVASAESAESGITHRGTNVRQHLEDRICSRLSWSIARRPHTFLRLPDFCDGDALEPPEVELSADPMVVSAGATSTLSWTSERAASCNASGGWSGSKSLNGNQVVTVNATTTYSLTCTNDEGSGSDSTTVNITPPPVPPTPPPPPPEPALTLNASPLIVLQSGTSTLSWDSSNANSCLASGGWSGSKSLDGSQIVTVNATTTYTLACGNGTATSTQSKTVAVIEPLSPTLDLDAFPNPVQIGATTTLSWNSEESTSCNASGSWNGSKPLDGNEIVTVSATSTYNLACGNGTSTSTRSVTVNVVEPTQPSLTFSASPNPVDASATTTLSWDSDDANTCSASGAWSGSRALNGNEIVTVNATSTYTLGCGSGLATTTKSVTVNVVPPPPPAVNISANPMDILSGATSTLTWSSTNSASCTASGGWTGLKALSGNEIVSPSATTTYTLGCFGNGATTTNSVTVGVTPATTSVNHVLISEIYNDTDATHGAEPSNEWIELYNPTAGAIDLSLWTIWDTATSSHDTLPFGTSIAAGGFLFITPTSATSTASLWSIPSTTPIVVISGASLGSNGLANAGDAVRLFNAATTTVDEMSYGSDTTVFNPSVVAATTSGRSLYRTSLATDTDSAADWGILASSTPGSF